MGNPWLHVEIVVCGCLVAKSCWTLLRPCDTVAPWAPLSMRFPWQEYWSRLPFPSPRDLTDPGIELTSPALAGGFLPLSHLGSHMLQGGLLTTFWVERNVTGPLCWNLECNFPWALWIFADTITSLWNALSFLYHCLLRDIPEPHPPQTETIPIESTASSHPGDTSWGHFCSSTYVTKPNMVLLARVQ